MARHPDTVITPNTLLSEARERLPSPRRPEQPMSRAELADLINSALSQLYPERDLSAHYVDRRWVGKLERGEHRWPSPERRAALRHVLGVTHDVDLGLYIARRTTWSAAMRAPQLAAPQSRINEFSASTLLGYGSVTIITPLKQEAVRARPVVALEDVVGAQRLGDLAKTLALDTRFETVPIGGEVDLNRGNLVVICGPRLSRRTAAILDQDPRIRFEPTPSGIWTLRDNETGLVHRSGLDETPARNWDVAYLGRLPRLDGKGTLIIFTGIHPQGSLGVVHLITTTIHELHRETAEHCFSMLVGTQFSPDTGEPVRVDRLTPVYWHEGAPAPCA
ncbi:helix-turn-helix domain-containing protein [Micromonospora sp. WMMD737]|uniref:helix-turn-helix domain-containing protein n=1 Tax=Micromonospora sp. WMMD737 TaxID=3404113 RepID=UPI003B965084